MTDKQTQFAAMITGAIGDALQNEENEFHIDLKEDDLTDFFHALANMAPTMIYSDITGKEVNLLEFNHIANQLCFQNMKNEKAKVSWPT